MVILLLFLGLFASAQTFASPPYQALVASVLDESDQPQTNIEAKDALLGPKGLIGADFTVPLMAAIVVLFGLGACMCLSSDKKRSQPDEFEGFVRLDA